MLLYLIYIARVAYTATRLKSGFAKVFLKPLLRTAYFALFVLALLGPAFGTATKELRAVGKDIYVAVDLSRSMLAQDVGPSRLERVKFEMKKLVDRFVGDRIGIIIFSSDAFIQCPLTSDPSALGLLIESLNTGLVPNTGTDFGPPLELAIEKLTSEESKVEDTRSKIIILISDGEDFGEETEAATSTIKKEDIRVFTLGVGTEKGGRIPVRNGFKRDRNGDEVITKLDASALKNLANETDGRYFEISTDKDEGAALLNKVANIEGEVRDAKTMDVKDNRYYYFLLAALALLLLDIMTDVKVLSI